MALDPVVHVAVVGPGDAARPVDVERAREVGRLLGRAGAAVLTGGLGGVMAAALAGVAEAGGVGVALQPGAERVPSAATVTLPTGLGELRNAVLVRCADAVIAVGGSWGTLSEVALARRTGTPVVVLDGWQVSDQAGQAVELATASTAADAVDRALAAAHRR